MELTLIPIAAILVLLAGLAAPAQPAPEALPCSAALSLWLRRERHLLPPGQRLRSSNPRRRSPAPCAACNHLDAPAARALQVCRKRGRTLFRTRFGISGGAYRPMAPPTRW